MPTHKTSEVKHSTLVAQKNCLPGTKQAWICLSSQQKCFFKKQNKEPNSRICFLDLGVIYQTFYMRTYFLIHSFLSY